jgi:phage FluMu protein Com
VVDENPRCWRCKVVLAPRLTRPWDVKCRNCKANNGSKPEWMKEEEAHNDE